MNSNTIGRFNRILLVLSIQIVLAPLLAAEDRTAIVVPVSGKIRVDGILNDPMWQGDPSSIALTQVDPHPGEPPTEATKVWLAYASEALYIAVRCEDRKAKQIVATEMRRDAFLSSNDNIEIVLDTFHDHRNAYYFATNAAGAMVEGRITENQFASLEWDGIWNVRTHIDETGWTAEFEIPFKTIGFDPNISIWGFNISRFLARGREKSRWASPSPDIQLSQVVKAGHITGIKNPSQGVGLDIKPFGIAGFSRERANHDRTQATRDAGVDIFYRITSNLVSSTTINTDFAETEVDTRQVNLTRFRLFYPEKRSFFLEDAGIFEFAKSDGGGMFGGSDFVPFFSRRIGLVQGWTQDYEIPIRIGQKLTGKIGRFDVGLLDVQTGRFTEDGKSDGLHLASKNLAVGRVKANFMNQSYVGAIFTNGDPTGQTSNQMAGVDLKLATSNFLNRQKNLSLMLFGSKTYTSGLDKKDSSFGGTVSYPNDLISLQYKWMKIGENYNPALGFLPRHGVRISSFNAQISPRPEFWNIRRIPFFIAYDDYYRMDRGTWETKQLIVDPINLAFNSGDWVGYEWRYNREKLFEPWPINFKNMVTLPAGEYSHNSHNFFIMTSQSRAISIQNDFGIGSFYSGTQRRVFLELTYRKSPHFTTSFNLQQNWIRLKEGDFNTSLVIYRLDYCFTPFITLSNFVQYDTDSSNIGLQSRLRWILKPGNEFFFVINHSWQENALNRFESDQTRFRVKLNYVFRL
ncbi:MAG: carbohydrate binding family 9 domain-containing protein [Acidobacteria bacterium]|nr:carbohydrate binding family 9 domain-containing protein [Acidobacteriota bacterium]